MAFEEYRGVLPNENKLKRRVGEKGDWMQRVSKRIALGEY